MLILAIIMVIMQVLSFVLVIFECFINYILLQIGRKILLISTAALNFVIGVVVAALLQVLAQAMI